MYSRVIKKIRLWRNFYKISANFYTVLWYRAVNLLRLDSVIRYDATIILKNGKRIYYGNPMDLSAVPVVVEIWLEQVYTPEGFNIESNDIVFDLGANVGNFSLFAAQKSKGKIYAFEPVLKNFALLEKNIALNNAHNIVPIQSAVSGKDGTVTMHVSNVDTAHSITHELFGKGKILEVPSVSLDSFCEKHGIERINFLKIDCEGAEFEIIHGLSNQLLSKIHKIIMEHHERYMHGDHKQLMAFLEQHGFIVKEFDEQYISAVNRSFYM